MSENVGQKQRKNVFEYLFGTETAEDAFITVCRACLVWSFKDTSDSRDLQYLAPYEFVDLPKHGENS